MGLGLAVQLGSLGKLYVRDRDGHGGALISTGATPAPSISAAPKGFSALFTGFLLTIFRRRRPCTVDFLVPGAVVGQESQEARRYRLLAAKARQSAAHASDPKIQGAYEDIAKQYDELAVGVERLIKREQGFKK